MAAESNTKQKQREFFAMRIQSANNVGELGVAAVSKAQAVVRVARRERGEGYRCQRPKGGGLVAIQ